MIDKVFDYAYRQCIGLLRDPAWTLDVVGDTTKDGESSDEFFFRVRILIENLQVDQNYIFVKKRALSLSLSVLPLLACTLFKFSVQSAHATQTLARQGKKTAKSVTTVAGHDESRAFLRERCIQRT